MPSAHDASESSQQQALAGSPRATEASEPEVYQERWESIWSAGLGRGERWDAAKASPALVDLLEAGKVDVKGKRVLVPGCGRGYDLPVFLSAGARGVVGLELAPTAAREAQAYLREVATAASPSGAGEQAAGPMRVDEGDFFTWSDGAVGEGSWDVGYDYTFGCAMHPSMRGDWSRHWGRHVRPAGQLVTLVFPVNPEADPLTGPPFPVSPELYRQLLEPQGFEVEYEAVVPQPLSHAPRAGKEVMMVWRKKAVEGGQQQ